MNRRKQISFREGISKWVFGSTVAKRIARIYVLIILSGFGALNLPWVKSNGHQGSQGDWFSKLFTSVSAFTTTGLLSGDSLKCSFNFWGQLIVLILIQIGGLGIVTLWMILKQTIFKNKKYSIEDRLNIHSERGGVSEGSSYKIIKSALVSLIGFELFVAVLLTFFFYFIGSTPEKSTGFKGQFWDSLWAGVFHSISAVNNAGLDILSTTSINSFSKGWGTLLSIVFAVCSMVGGIGYTALYEFKEWFLKKKSKLKTKNIFSIFTKISLLMYLAITVLAGGGIILAEYTVNKNWESGSCKDGKCNGLSDIERIWQLVYLVISSRSAGFYGIDPNCLHEKSQWILLLLMFIGASPASTAGGIRSITLFLMLGKIWITVRGRRSLSIFSRSISDQTIESAYVVFFVSSTLITLSSLGVLSNLENDNNKALRHASLFEVASAFGTAGLSLGVSAKTNVVGKIILMCLMFIGQLGVPNSLIYYNNPRAAKQKFSYPEEKLRIA